jgi:glyoxylase-like metal-dependent hydrolase (beta-lactamase superfamily II)
MRELADGVWQLKGKPANNVNVYVLGDVLIDSGAAFDKKRVLSQIEGREIKAHALTHAHFDHYGSSHAVCTALDIPLWVGEKDVAEVEVGKQIGVIPGLGDRQLPAARRHPVERALKEGDEVAGFEVLFTPGHSPGHISYWRESDRVLVCGDVMWGYNPFTLRGPIREPFPVVSPDPKLNRDSARKLAALEPELVLFGHGAPLSDPAKFARAVAKLS